MRTENQMGTQTSTETVKIAFANQLRGIAALMVLVSHYYGSFFWDQQDIASIMRSPAYSGTTPWIIPYINSKYFSFGPLGVAIFFLISGFVIPFSLQRLSGSNFLKARLLRIYPTYWVGLLFGLMIIAITGWQGNKIPYPFSISEIVANLSLFNLYYGKRGIDFVNWTLAIEIKFYLIAWLLASTIRAYKVKPLWIFALLIAIGNILLYKIQPTLTTSSTVHAAVKIGILLHELQFVAFMFLGTLFYFHFKQQLTTYQLVFNAILLAFFIAIAWRYSMYKGEFPHVSYNYIYALGIFSSSYFFRHAFRSNRIIDFFADISYPLYILHALVGFAFIEMLTAKYLFSYNVAALLAFLIIVFFAYLLHRYVEVYFIKVGQKWRAPLPLNSLGFSRPPGS